MHVFLFSYESSAALPTLKDIVSQKITKSRSKYITVTLKIKTIYLHTYLPTYSLTRPTAYPPIQYKMTHAFFFGPQFSPSYGRSSTSFTSYGSVRPPVFNRPVPPQLPHPVVLADNEDHNQGGSVPSYRPGTNSPPPAYSPILEDDDEHKSFLQSDLEARFPQAVEEDDSEDVCGKMSNVVITILIVLNVFVWSAVFYGVICDDEAPRLWEAIQQSDRVVFDV